jgi:plasmid maintenance system antidote protein VapI
MQLREYIDAAATKAGSVAALARLLGLVQQSMNEAKHHRRPLPLDAAIKLADYIGADRIAVISANELATEKKEEKRQFWSHLLGQQNRSSMPKLRFTE